MARSETAQRIRNDIRADTLRDEALIAKRLMAIADFAPEARQNAATEARDFVEHARASAARSSLIDKFLQEYGLSTAEGVTLMRLAEALLRTPDAATADALIKDKIDAGDWRSHAGKSPFPLVNFSTRALMLTATWVDDVEAKDPTGRFLKATKSLLDRLGDPTIRTAVGQAMGIMGEHFVLGETIKSALRRGQKFADLGYTFSFDMLGEAALTASDADRFYQAYADAIKTIAGSVQSDKIADNPGISVKLSALHPRYEYAQKERVENELTSRVRDLAIMAKTSGLGFNIDAEEADRLDLSLNIIEALAHDPALSGWDGLGVVVQAYQRRALNVVQWLANLARETNRRLMVRLVKGAYWDSEIKRAQELGLESYPVFTRKLLTDISYTACAKTLLDNADVIYPQFATHNALSVALVRQMAPEGAEFELQRLHGMGEALHDRLLEKGARSRIYAPVGGHKELLPYLVRRLLENGANSSFVNQLFDPDLSVDDIIADPLAEALQLASLANPAIPAPRDLFSGERYSSIGWDFTDPETAERLSAAVSRANWQPQKACPLIDGAELGGKAEPVFSPIDGAEIGTVAMAEDTHVAEALSTARRGCENWASTSPTERAKILRTAATALEKNGEAFMAIACQEAGKTIPDAIAEVREAVDFLNYYAARAETADRQPYGVIACISPWNFPLAIFVGQIAACLAAGNTVIAKPAEQTPLIAFKAVKLLHEAGIPANALQFLPGDGPCVGAPLTRSPDIDGVLFTGSTDTAQMINRSMREQGNGNGLLVAETGGINAMIIDSTALLEQAVQDVVASAFQSAGQRCSACRLVLVQRDIKERFIQMLAGAMHELSIGNPARLRSDVGPVIDQDAKERIDAHIDKLKNSARLIAQTPFGECPPDGRFIAPTAFELSSIDDLEEEIFGPVLHVVPFDADDLLASIDHVNSLGFGLTMGLHTRIDDTMEEVAAKARVGNLYVNRNQIGAVVGVQPFGGEALSGTGPKAGGNQYVANLQRTETFEHQVSNWTINEQTPPPLLNQQIEHLSATLNNIGLDKSARRANFIEAARKAGENGDAHAVEVLRQAASLTHDIESPVELPGPTGESNTVLIKSRGIILCLGPEIASTVNQVARALALGNGVICNDSLAAGLKHSLTGTPLESSILGTALSNGVSRRLLADPRLQAVAFDGDKASFTLLAQVLARRSGPIIPILSEHAPLWRYGTERTLTINTTAAGGDVRLLSAQ